MKKLILEKEISKRFKAISMASIMLVTMLSGCSSKNDTKSDIESSMSSLSSQIPNEPTPSESTTSSNSEIVEDEKGTSSLYKTEKELVLKTEDKIESLFKNMNEEVVKNSTLIILLDELAKEDENGKIKADIISNFKSKIDSNNMMNDFNTFLDTLENTMIKDKKLVSVSNILPTEQKDDKKILSNIEKITSNIINSKDEKQIVSEFDKIYTLFVDEDEIEVDGFKFEVRDLSFSNRAIASAYARVCAYYSRNYITDEKYSRIDKRTNDQNSKAYIKTKLEILNNQMDEKSEIDVIKVFNDRYDSFNELLNGKVKLTMGDEKDFINYINLEYLNSDKVATKDKREILVGYDDSKITDTILAIDAINEYNFKNQKNIIIYSDLLVDEYQKTSTGKIDTLALNFIEYNTIMLRNTVSKDAEFTDVFNNPYFQNVYKYLLKQNVVYKYVDGNNKNKETTIVYQEVSDNVNLFCNEMIYNTLNKLPKVKYMDDYIKQAKSNVEESVQHIQNVVSGECEKVDFENLEENKGEKEMTKK